MTIVSGSLQPSPSRGEIVEPRIVVHRIYDRSQPSTRRRVLVDRLWPRGVTKKGAHLDEWAKDVAPSQECVAGTVMIRCASTSSPGGIAANSDMRRAPTS